MISKSKRIIIKPLEQDFFETRRYPINISLPASKSLSNRYLILQAIAEKFQIENLSEANDTQILQKLLSNYRNSPTINVEDAGTTARFMTAFLANEEGGKWRLTGTTRMQRRPIKALVDALLKLDADIQYEKKEGYLPLLIKGKKLKGEKIDLDVSQSSQFLSALLLISPKLGELEILFSSTPISFPYAMMTMDILRNFGAKIDSSENGIKVDSKKLSYKSVEIESDWSAAAFWYSCVALSEDQNIRLQLNGLQKNSLQGDRKSVEYFELLGVETIFNNQGIEIKKNNRVSQSIKLNLTHHPDLAQALIVTAAALGIKGEFTGLQSLKIKETNRIDALVTELKELNISISSNNKDTIFLSGKKTIKEGKRTIQTYQDHRMAMSFSPLALILNNIEIQDPKVVDKSYPDFWLEMSKIADVRVIK